MNAHLVIFKQCAASAANAFDVPFGAFLRDGFGDYAECDANRYSDPMDIALFAVLQLEGGSYDNVLFAAVLIYLQRVFAVKLNDDQFRQCGADLLRVVRTGATEKELRGWATTWFR